MHQFSKLKRYANRRATGGDTVQHPVMAYQELHFGGVGRRPVPLSDLGAVFMGLALVVFFISDTLLSLDSSYSQSIKVVAFSLLVSAIMLRPRFHKKILLIGPIIAVLCISLLRTFSMDAGLEEFMRFLFPVIITVSIYAYRDKLNVLIGTLIFVVLTNDLFQIYFFIAYIAGLPTLLPVRIDSGTFLRAQGWLGFFSEFAYLNFCAFILYRNFSAPGRGKSRSWFFMVFAVLAFSFKLLVAAIFYPLSMKKLSMRKWMILAAALLVVGLGFSAGLLDSLISVASSKVAFYITEGNSARAESYRVMFESLSAGNLLGEGLGSFGGPASVKYGSPLYAKYHFDWYGLGGVLKTTDTFYPHLFVELGLVGALIWCSFMIFYGQGEKKGRLWWFFVIVLLVDNFFSMSLLSPGYVFSALLVMYVISRPEVGVSVFGLDKKRCQLVLEGK
jgi:hypothetical protein